MPKVEFYKPAPSLQWIIKQFETIKYDRTSKVFSDIFIPRPDAALVFHFKNIPQVVVPVNKALKRVFVAPVVTTPYQLLLEGEIDGFIVVCKVPVLSRIFKLDMQLNSKIMIEVDDEIFGPLWKKLLYATSDLERINCFSQFIQNYASAGYNPDRIDTIYDEIVENIVNFSLQDTNSNSLQSLSSIQRNFKKHVGVSMKKLMRISRVNYIFKNMLNDNRFDAQKLMFNGNYYDQPHFINDFKELTGEAPKQFLSIIPNYAESFQGCLKKI